VLDLAGNVWERCLNKYDSPEVVTVDGSDDLRGLRGGAWSFGLDDCCVSFRGGIRPFHRDASVGFLAVVSPFPLNNESSDL
jgi:formylglycine-generating enzyme required for sulfatase activity